jgi:hypothetical protein
MEYLAPMFGEFTAASSLQGPQSWGRQLRMLERKGVARFSVTSELYSSGTVAGRFSGEFVALPLRAAQLKR